MFYLMYKEVHHQYYILHISHFHHIHGMDPQRSVHLLHQ